MSRQTIDIEHLLQWVYGAQQAHRSGAGGAMPSLGWNRGFSADGCVRIAEIQALGIDLRGISRNLGYDLHPDAETVSTVINRTVEREMRIILVQYAVACIRPAWGDAATWWAGPVLRGNGKPKMIYDHHRNAVACEVECKGPSPEYIASRRQLYRDWWGALEGLCVTLNALPLRDHHVVGPHAPAAPWEQLGRRQALAASLCA